MQKFLLLTLMTLPIFLLTGCERVASPLRDRPDYPAAQRLSHSDILHGIRVSDPYRWLEADADETTQEGAAVSSWLAAQRSLSTGYFASVPSRAALHESLTELWNFERREAPRRFGDRWFLFRNTDSADQYALAMQHDLSEEPEILIDPAQWSDPQRQLAAVSISPDGRFLAWLQTNVQGRDRRWQLRDLNAAAATPDIELDWLDVDDIAWHSDSGGFFYSASAAESSSATTAIYFHELRPDTPPPSTDVSVHLSAGVLRILAAVDGRWLIATEEVPTDTTRVLLLDLERPESSAVVLGEGAPNAMRYLGARDDELFLLSVLDDRAGTVISIDPHADGNLIPTVVVGPEQRQILRALPMRDGVLVEYLEEGVSVLEVVATDGSRRPLPLPGPGRISSLFPGEFDNEVLYGFSTLTMPTSVSRLNTTTGEHGVLFAPDLSFSPEEFVVERLEGALVQGGRIPVLVAGRRDRLRAEGSKLLLEVYGGFGIALDSGFSTARMGWMAQGGIYAIAGVRGGGELGPRWHEQAMGTEKSRSIDDLLLVVQQLQDLGFVERERLAVMGASHGAMLVAAAVNKAPSQFGAAVLSAGPMDMLRLAELGGVESWQAEYGSVTTTEQFSALLDYSPYHNVRSGTVYPATLVLTTEHDDVVTPAHSYKYVARLQAEADPSSVVLLRTQPGSEHMDTGTVVELIDRYAERWAFVLHALKP